VKVTDAFWELRNLGVKTNEIEIEQDDNLKEINETLQSLDSEYQVVKVGTCRLDVYEALSRNGFYLAEALIRVSHSLKELSCPGLIKRFSDGLTLREMDSIDVQKMNEQIKGGMFQTDRVILDPFFNPEQAANRYVLWMTDEMNRGSKLYSYVYKDQPIGFTCLKETEPGFYYPVLGGVYNTGKASPFGSAIIYKQLEFTKELGGKELYTYISSNNSAVVRAYSQLGYVFEDIKYVFVKHMIS